MFITTQVELGPLPERADENESAVMIGRCKFDEAIEAGQRRRVAALLEELAFTPLSGMLEVSVLAGGANNINLVLKDGVRRYTLKLRDPICTSFGVDPGAAVECQKAAAALGVAPRIFASASPAGHFISEFIDGLTLRPHVIRERGLAAAIVAALKRLHTAHGSFRTFWIFDDLRTFMNGARAIGGHCSAELRELYAMALSVEGSFRAMAAPMALCHNDLVPQNMLLCEESIRFVDFDYAGRGWIAVDLAGATSQAEMTPQETEEFLAAYDPGLDDAQRARIQAIHLFNAIREAAWAAYAEPALAHKTALLEGWSYEAHGRMNLALARVILEQRSLGELTRTAADVRPGALF